MWQEHDKRAKGQDVGADSQHDAVVNVGAEIAKDDGKQARGQVVRRRNPGNLTAGEVETSLQSTHVDWIDAIDNKT